MKKTYLLTMRPLEPYFFGNEKTFAFDPKTPAENRYFIKSERMPLQTTVLGVLRYLLMPVKNSSYTYTSEEQARNAAVVGAASFAIDRKEQCFGAIEKLSPVFLVRGKDKYVRTPFDHCPDVDGSYKPMTQYKTEKTEQGMCMYFSDYNAKKGIHDSFMAVADGTLVKSDEIFGSTVRVGVDKLRHEKGFYKKQFMYLEKDWSFGAYVTLDTDRIAGDGDAQKALSELKAGTAAYLGQNKSAFAVRLMEEENTIGTLMARHLQKGRIYCFGDTLADAAVYQGCAFAATMTRDYRAYSTSFVAKEQGAKYVGTVSKDARLYKLLAAGSVLIPREGHDLSACLRKKHCENIGFNITIPSGEE